MSVRTFTLLFLPAILIVSLFIGIRIFQYNQLTKLSQPPEEAVLDIIPLLAADPILGNKRAPITIVTFEDLGCSGCRTQDGLLTNLIQKHPDKVKVVWKSLSVTSLPHPTQTAHAYAYCAHQQKQFEAFKREAFVNQLDLSGATLDALVTDLELDEAAMSNCLASGEAQAYEAQNEAIARSLQIQSVPAIFIDNTQITPPTSVVEWERTLGLL